MESFKELKHGDYVKHVSRSEVYTVLANYGVRVTAVRHADLTNPHEWNKLDQYGDVENPEEDYVFEFGKNKYYFKGQVCVWNGKNPAVVRIGGSYSPKSEYYYIEKTPDYNSLSFRYFRPATREEIERLGNRNVLVL